MANEQTTTNLFHKVNDRVFADSAHIKVFPCGRRRAEEVQSTGTGTGSGPITYIPFDPEARLNTEANNRKHSSLNGFSQSYIRSWEENACSIVLNGYLFEIETSEQSITEQLVNTLESSGTDTLESSEPSEPANTVTAIYANIVLEDTKLFARINETLTYTSAVLASQSSGAELLDLFKNIDSNNVKHYYFSGLSFSAAPLKADTFSGKQSSFSLCVLQKIGDDWQPYLPAYLPKIEHGDTNDSIKVGGKITATGLEIINPDGNSNSSITSISHDKIETGDINVTGTITQDNGKPVPTISLQQDEEQTKYWQLVIGGTQIIAANPTTSNS